VYLFEKFGAKVLSCDACRLVFSHPQPSDSRLSEIYSESYFLGSDEPDEIEATNALKKQTAIVQLCKIERYLDRHLPGHGRKLLEIGCGHGSFLVEAEARGFNVWGVEYSADATAAANKRLGAERVLNGSVEAAGLSERGFDVCVIIDAIEHVRNPVTFLETIHEYLRPGGVLFLTTPSMDSLTARLLRSHWFEFKEEHLFYFGGRSIRNLLHHAGFGGVLVEGGRKVLTLDYVGKHFDRFRVPLFTPLLKLTRALLPGVITRHPIKLPAAGMDVYAIRGDDPPPMHRQRTLSVVMPVYNEKQSFRDVAEELVNKHVDGLNIEIIMVESNSTDGTREEVLSYESHPRVKVVLEDRPRGKGHAVRQGFRHATGDIILIQDADREYDLNDYEMLLTPLLHYRHAFVLGSRHSGNSWKMRHFEDQVFTSLLMNAAHIFFTTFFNVLYSQRLKDPFTMYKVFLRECIRDMPFEGNRFDFDCELVAKLVRRGYTPLEVPVNYASRSFSEGKKVSFFRDPPTYVWAFLKHRFSALEVPHAAASTTL